MCYNTFGCANDCDAALKKVRGTLQKTSSDVVGAVGDMQLEEQIKWAFSFPFETLKEAREKGHLVKGEMKNIEQKIQRNKSPSVHLSDSTTWKKNGWWWPLE